MPVCNFDRRDGRHLRVQYVKNENMVARWAGAMFMKAEKKFSCCWLYFQRFREISLCHRRQRIRRQGRSGFSEEVNASLSLQPAAYARAYSKKACPRFLEQSRNRL